MLGDIKDKRLLYAKGVLFVITGSLAVALLLFQYPHWDVALLTGIAIWCFARAYYFAFYVIEHYVDPGYKFAGLGSFVRYALKRKKDQSEPPTLVGGAVRKDGASSTD